MVSAGSLWAAADRDPCLFWPTTLSLDGINDYVDVPDGVWFGDEFTVEAWVLLRAYHDQMRLFDFGNGAYQDNVVGTLSVGDQHVIQFAVFVGSSALTVSSDVAIALNTWTHVAFARDAAGTGRVYLNGTDVKSGSLFQPPNILRTNNFLGRSNWDNNPDASAIFDEVRIWSVARNATELQAGMRSSLTGTEDGLRAYWRFNEATGDSASDATGHGFAGTLMNQPEWVAVELATESYTVVLPPGYSLIANQLNHGGNTLNEILAEVPVDAQLFYWDPALQAYAPDSPAFLPDIGWFPNPTLEPGQGAFLFLPQGQPTYSLTFTGTRRCAPRLPLNPIRGWQLVSDQRPQTGDFASIVGLPPEPDTKVVRWNPSAQAYVTNVFVDGSWSPGAPAAQVGESWFLYWPKANPIQITCPGDVTVQTGPDSCVASVNTGQASVTGGYTPGGPPVVTGVRSDALPVTDPYPAGTTVITWTARDASGNSESCTQRVTVNRTADSYTIALVPGLNFIANQLDNGGNTLAEIFPDVPDGTTLFKFDTCQQLFLPAASFLTGLGWIDAGAEPSSLTLEPGEGAFLQFLEPKELTLTGLRRCARRLPLCPIQGSQVVSDQVPDTGSFATIMGLDPVEATAVYTWEANAQLWVTNLFTSGAWSLGPPTADVGQAWWVYWPLESPSSITIVCPPDQVLSAEPGQCSAAVDVGRPAATGGCICDAPQNGPPVVTATRSDGLPLADPYPVGATYIAWTATNASGGLASCSQRIEVKCVGASCPDSYTVTLFAGVLNLIANQLDNGDNTLNEVLPLPGALDGATVFKFDAGAQEYAPAATFVAGFGWLPPAATLAPGEGAYLDLPGQPPAELTFTGLRRCERRLPLCPVQGYQLVSDPLPEPGDFASIVGLAPVQGTKVIQQTLGGFVTNTFDGSAWSPTPPTARAGEAWFLFWPAQDPFQMVCPADIVVDNDFGQGSASVSVRQPSVTGGCSTSGGPTVTGVRSDGAALSDPYPVGTTTITWTATEASGRSVTCTQQVRVNRTAESYRIALVSGMNLIANPLDQGGNTLAEVLPDVPDGAALFKFDPCQQLYLPAATFVTGVGWLDENSLPSSMTLEPGEGAFLQVSEPYELTLTGLRRGARQLPVCPVQGHQFVSDQLPEGGNFASIVGLAPLPGTKVHRWLPDLQAYVTNSFDDSTWSPAPPTAGVGEPWVLEWPAASPLQLACQPNVVVAAASGACGAVVPVTPPIPTGACRCTGGSSATVTGVRSDGLPLTDPYPVDATTTITWTAQDGPGQTATCAQRVIVNCSGCNYTVHIVAGKLTPIANQCGNMGTVAALMPAMPLGTRLWKWNPQVANYDPVNVFGTGWGNPRQTLNPGEGAFILSPLDTNVTITGTCSTPVLPYPYLSCCAVLASRQMACPGNYTNILGVLPADGVKVYRWDTAIDNWGAPFTYSSATGWDPNPPIADVGEWLFFQPNPSEPCPPTAPQASCLSIRQIPKGYSLIANQCQNVSRVSFLLPNPPDKTMLWKYHNDPANGHFEVVNVFNAFSGAWNNPSQVLFPGEGALLYNPGESFPMVVAGVANTPTLPLPLATNAGWYLVSCQTSEVGTWANIVGELTPTLGAKMVKVLPGVSPDLEQLPEWQSAEYEETGWSSGPLTTAVGEAIWIRFLTPPDAEPNPPHPAHSTYTWMLKPGLNLIANQGLNANTIALLLPQLPEGSLLLKYNNFDRAYEPVNFTFNTWNKPQQKLLPGEGAWLFNAGGDREVTVYGAPNTPHSPLPGVDLAKPGPYLVSAQTNTDASLQEILFPDQEPQPLPSAVMYRYKAGPHATMELTDTALVGEAVWIYPLGVDPQGFPDFEPVTPPNLTNYVYNKTIVPGSNLIANQLDNESTVSTLFPYAPFGTYLLVYNTIIGGFEEVNTFTVGGWARPGQQLLPGDGAWLVNSSSNPFQVHISGTPIASAPGSPVDPNAPCGLLSHQSNSVATYSDIMGPTVPPNGTLVGSFNLVSQKFENPFTYSSDLHGWLGPDNKLGEEPKADIGEPLLIYGLAGCGMATPKLPVALNIFRTPCKPCYVTVTWQYPDGPRPTLQIAAPMFDPETGKPNWQDVPGNPGPPVTTNCCPDVLFYRNRTNLFRLRFETPPTSSQ